MDFIFCECPRCDYTAIHPVPISGEPQIWCWVCGVVDGQDVRMTHRPVKEDDSPTGFDGRLVKYART